MPSIRQILNGKSSTAVPDDVDLVSPGPGRKRSPIGFQALRLLAGVVLVVGFLGWDDHWRDLAQVFADIDTTLLVDLLVVAVALDVISCLRWGLFLGDENKRVGFWQLLRIYWIGRFFNNFIPSMIGGDIARATILARTVGSLSRSSASVIMERGSGLVGLTLLALVFVPFNLALFGHPLILVCLGGGMVGCGLLVLLFYFGLPGALTGGLPDRTPPLVGRLVGKLARLADDLARFRHRHRLVAASLFYSLIWQLLAGVNIYLACMAVGLAPSPSEVMLISPVIQLLAMIPVSPNNIGWWEWSFSVLLAQTGALAATGFAVGMILRGTALTLSLVGGFLLAIGPLGLRRRSAAPVASELEPARPPSTG